MLGSLATLGYASRELDAETTIQEVFAVNARALLVDTRHSPACSWSPLWQRANLQARYGARYRYRGDWLGNVNHARPDAPIRLADAAQGISWLIRGLEAGYTLILLCGCAHYRRCHRKVIYDLVKAQLGDRLPEYGPGQRVMTPYGPGSIASDIPLEIHRARNRYAVLLDHWYQGVRVHYCFPHELTPYEVTQPALLA